MDEQNPKKGNAKGIIIGVLVTVLVVGGGAAAIYGGQAGWFSGSLMNTKLKATTTTTSVTPKTTTTTTTSTTPINTNLQLTQTNTSNTGTTATPTIFYPLSFFLQSNYQGKYLYNSTDIHSGLNVPIYGFRLKSLNNNTTTYINSLKFKFSGCFGDSNLKPKGDMYIHAIGNTGIDYQYEDSNRDGNFTLIEGSNQPSAQPSLGYNEYMDFYVIAYSTQDYCNVNDTTNVRLYEYIWKVANGNPVVEVESKFNTNTNANANTVKFS